jgi:ABC-type uncharacterized transport system permease subunit
MNSAAGFPSGWPLGLAVLALVGYATAAWPTRDGDAASLPRWQWLEWAFWAAVSAHVFMLVADIGGIGHDLPGARLGFGPVLSLTVCLVLVVHAAEIGLGLPPRLRRILACAGGAAVALALAYPGEPRLLASPLAPLHWVFGVASYGLFGAAVLHALLLDQAERRLRTPGAHGGFGLPLLQLERLTFRFVEAGLLLLTLAIVLGVLTTEQWRWDHKTVFSLLGWALFAGLVLGRRVQGWRGRRATRWVYIGAAVLLLAYVGSRFVFEVLLNRLPAAG